MRMLFIITFLLLSTKLFSQPTTTVYCFPGQGSDERIFSRIKLDSNYKIIHVPLPVPERGMNMNEYAHVISKQIDTSTRYVFIGVSLGGMVCCELTEFLQPEKTIIISSAKCRKELPFRYRFQHVIPLNKIIPKRLIKLGARILQPVVEPDRKHNKDTFKSMLKSKSPVYYKRTVNMIINWDRRVANNKIIHIHGTNDHTIPMRNVKANYNIEKGSHMMTLTRGEEINELLKSILAH